MVDVNALLKTPSFGLKFVELLFSFLSICLVIDGIWIGDNDSKKFTCYGTMVGFFMITIIFILLYLLDTPPHRFVLQVVGVAGFVMWLVTGSLIINHYEKYRSEDRVVVSGVFGLFTSVAYLIDAALAIMLMPALPT